jgi:2,3-dihydroxy-p-cumate/2,3-dihydroxybenzoate 3,4-dioxygenase
MSERLLESITYVRIPTRSPAESARFATGMLGLRRVEEESLDLKFRTDARSQSIVLTCDPQAEAALGVELRDDQALEAARAALIEAGFPSTYATDDECRQRAVRHALFTQDASGNRIELVSGPAISGQRFLPSRDSGIVGLSGAGLRSRNLDRDLMLWTKVLGATVSDRLGDITYLAMDSRHHRIVLYPSIRAGLLNIAIEVASFDDIMQNNYFFNEHQVRIVQGPGRDMPSEQIFLHFTGPEGVIYSFVTGMRVFNGTPPRARQFTRNKDTLCAWGSECRDGRAFPELTQFEPRARFRSVS